MYKPPANLQPHENAFEKLTRCHETPPTITCMDLTTVRDDVMTQMEPRNWHLKTGKLLDWRKWEMSSGKVCVHSKLLIWLTLVALNFRKHKCVCIFCNFSPQIWCGYLKPTLWKIWTPLSCIVNAMIADHLATHKARELAVMALTQ